VDGMAALSAPLSDPSGLAVGPDGLVYFSEIGQQHIRRLNADGTLSNLAGYTYGYAGDGGDPRIMRAVWAPTSLSFGDDGALYFADTENLRVRRLWIDPPSAPGPRGDLDGDGKVTVKDALIQWRWFQAIGDPPADPSEGDLNRTGWPDLQDVYLICERAIPGDLTGDGRLTIEDVAQLLKGAIELRDLSLPEIWVADLNRDGRVDLKDVSSAIRRVVGE
jgi:hypothetical protein